VGDDPDKREMQRLLELMLETLPVGVAVMDQSANVVTSNAMMTRIWGGVIAQAEKRYPRSVGFWHGSGKPVAVDEWGSQRAIHHGETRLNDLIDIDTLDGQRRTIRNSAAPIRDEGGRIAGVVVVNEDVTEQVRAEEELARRERQQTALARLCLSALQGDDPQVLLEEAVSLVATTLGVEYGLVVEWVPDEKRMKFRAGAGPWVAELVAGTTLPATPGFMAWFITHAQLPVVVEDLRRETRFAPCELLMAHGVTCGIAVPIAGKERPFGVLHASATTSRRFTDDEVSFVWGIANVLATSIEKASAAVELGEKREQLHALSRKLIEVQEAERRAVARELHDDFGQVLTALRLNLQRRSSDEKDNIALVDGAIARMRDLALDLRPPQLDDLGLESSLRWYVEREAARAGLKLQLSLDPLPLEPAPTVATACFRIVQEALTNVLRHAGANAVSVELRAAGGHLEVVVRDDGVGFDVVDARKRAVRGDSQGILGMRERAELVGGALEIVSTPGNGTAVRARFPLAEGTS
jgi:PAS domain S-box-containing protein